MKKYLIFTLLIGISLASCDKEDAILDLDTVGQEVDQAQIYDLDIATAKLVMSKDSIGPETNNTVSTRSSWQHYSGWSYNSGVGYHAIANVPKAFLQDYDVQVVLSSSNYQGALITHGYSPFRWVLGYYVNPNSTNSMVMTIDDLLSSETMGYFHSYSWTNNTAYSVEIYIRSKSAPVASNVDDYPWPGTTACHTTGGCDADIWLACKSNCTSWVMWQVNKAFGITSLNLPLSSYKLHNHTSGTGSNRLSHAHRWDNRLGAIGWVVNNTPMAGAICNWEATSGNPYGHIAYIHSVGSNGSITISEYNYSPSCEYNTRTIQPNSSQYPDHIIHVPL